MLRRLCMYWRSCPFVFSFVPLPGVVRGREVEARAGRLLDLGAGVELVAVAGDHGVHAAGLPGDQLNRALRSLGRAVAGCRGRRGEE